MTGSFLPLHTIDETRPNDIFKFAQENAPICDQIPYSRNAI